MDSFSFIKDEKLSSQKVIVELFTFGYTLSCFPLKVIWIKTGTQSHFPIQAAFSVPKKNFKKSHDRNFLKRRIREAYRLHKQQLYKILNLYEKSVALMFIYIGKEKQNFHEIESAIFKFAAKFEKEFSKEE